MSSPHAAPIFICQAPQRTPQILTLRTGLVPRSSSATAHAHPDIPWHPPPPPTSSLSFCQTPPPLPSRSLIRIDPPPSQPPQCILQWNPHGPGCLPLRAYLPPDYAPIDSKSQDVCLVATHDGTLHFVAVCRGGR